MHGPPPLKQNIVERLESLASAISHSDEIRDEKFTGGNHIRDERQYPVHPEINIHQERERHKRRSTITTSLSNQSRTEKMVVKVPHIPGMSEEERQLSNVATSPVMNTENIFRKSDNTSYLESTIKIESRLIASHTPSKLISLLPKKKQQQQQSLPLGNPSQELIHEQQEKSVPNSEACAKIQAKRAVHKRPIYPFQKQQQPRSSAFFSQSPPPPLALAIFAESNNSHTLLPLEPPKIHQRHHTISSFSLQPPQPPKAVTYQSYLPPNFYNSPSDMPANPHMHTTHRGAKIEHLPLKAAPSIKNNWPAYHGIKKHGRNLTEIGEAAEIRPSDYVGVINYVLDGDYFEEKKQKQQLRVGNSGSSGIFRRLGSSILNTMDFAGQKLAGLFGITDGRYEEYYEDCEAYEHDIAMTEVYVGAAVAAEELKLALS